MPDNNTLTFKDENRAMQELTRELLLLRQHNLKFRDGEPYLNASQGG
jgi:hypothetical protein